MFFVRLVYSRSRYFLVVYQAGWRVGSVLILVVRFKVVEPLFQVLVFAFLNFGCQSIEPGFFFISFEPFFFHLTVISAVYWISVTFFLALILSNSFIPWDFQDAYSPPSTLHPNFQFKYSAFRFPLIDRFFSALTWAFIARGRHARLSLCLVV